MFLKIMCDENLADNVAGKPYRIIDCSEVIFMRGQEGGLGWAQVDGSMVALEGNAYILNAKGQTIDSFWPCACKPAEPAPPVSQAA
jgi:hypothetical protein